MQIVKSKIYFQFFLSTLLMFVASSAFGINVSLPDTCVTPGSELLLPVSITDLGGQSPFGFRLHISYDKTRLQAVGAENKGTLSDGFMMAVNTSRFPGEIILSAASTYPFTQSGILILLRFQVLPAAPLGVTSIYFKEVYLGQDVGPVSHRNCKVTVVPVCIEMQPLPILTIAENSTDSSLILDDFVASVEDSTPHLNWSFTGNQNIAVSIDTGSTRVILTSADNWYGKEQIIFTGSLQGNVIVSGTLNVSVLQVFAVVEVSLPDTVVKGGTSISLPVMVTDLTGKAVEGFDFCVGFDKNILKATGAGRNGTLSSGFLTVVNTNIEGQIIVAAASSSAIVGGGVLIYLNFEVTPWTSDPIELFFKKTDRNDRGFRFNSGVPATLMKNGSVGVENIISLNNLPDIDIFANFTDDGLMLNNYLQAENIDTSKISWSYSGNDNIEIYIDENNSLVTITPADDWTGTEKIIFTCGYRGFEKSDSIYVNVYYEYIVTQELALIPGWNLVSLGVAPEDNSVSSIFPDALAVYSWENNAYVNPSTVKCGEAYWVAVMSSQTITVTGERCTNWSRNLSTGWHLIGALFESKPISSLSPSSSVIIVYNFNPSTGQYIPASALEHGKGYWLAVNSDDEFSLSKFGEPGIPFALSKTAGNNFLKRFSETPPPLPDLNYGSLADEEINIPKKFKLMQNYPNPFNPETAIKFELPENIDVTLKIYNTIGQEVRTLITDNKNAGYHSVIWDSKNNFGFPVSSGVYIYMLKAGDFIISKKMVLMR